MMLPNTPFLKHKGNSPIGITVLLLSLLTLLNGCGGGGQETTTNEDPRLETSASYTGPVPANTEIQSFKLQLWDNLSPNNRCGSCHGDGQEPQFVRSDDINKAYVAALGKNSDNVAYVDLTSPADSLMSTKVAAGHHCWEASNQVCADTIKLYIERWAGDRAGGDSQTIILSAPEAIDPGASRNFPDSSALFANELHPLLVQYCAGCHVDSPPAPQSPQSPFFASADADTAYLAAQSKIDLDTPSISRFVVRLGSEFHQCWDDCSSNAGEIQQAITNMANAIPITEVDSALVTSKALLLANGIPANSGGRYQSNVIALYEFKEGSGSTAYDRSGITPSLHLTLPDNVEWVGGWGIRITDGKAQGSTTSSAKLHDLITATGEYSIEAWVAPANVTQEDSYIISYSAGTSNRNFTLGQTLYNYDFLHRSSTTDANGEPALSTLDDDEELQAVLQHVVATFSPEGRKLYVNGELVDTENTVVPGNLNDWNNSYAFVLGNEVSSGRQWQGTFKMVAIHNRALTPAQITQNFEVGVGQKFYLLFGISDWIDVPESYIVFEVSQFDSYSYLFNTPFYTSLSDTALLGGLKIQGMRIGINGREATIGQAYQNIDITLNRDTYAAEGQQSLSLMGTVIPIEKGADDDEFFLTFELLGDNQNVYVEAEPNSPASPADAAPSPAIGLRTFDEINATMAAVTGVSIKAANVDNTFQTIKQQLPTNEDVNGFLSAHQVAIAQLAIEYCSGLVDTVSLRDSFFTDNNFNFGARSDVAFDTTIERDAITNPLLDKFMGENLTIQPDKETIRTELNDLIDILDGCSDCSTDSDYIERTGKVVKGTCAAVLGSAVMLVQ